MDRAGPTTSPDRHLALGSGRESSVGPKQLRWIATDPDIFGTFHRGHVAGVRRFVARRVVERGYTADLTAEILIKARESADRYRPSSGTPRAWLYGIARIVAAADALRRHSKRNREERWGCARVDADDTAQIEADARSRELFPARDRLPVGGQEVLELVVSDELAVAEAAAALGVRPAIAAVPRSDAAHVARRTRGRRSTTQAKGG